MTDIIDIEGRALPLITSDDHDAMKVAYAADAHRILGPGVAFSIGGCTSKALDTPEPAPAGVTVTRRDHYWLAYVGDHAYVGYIHKWTQWFSSDGRRMAQSGVGPAAAVRNLARQRARGRS